MSDLILASASPRRADLLRMIGCLFEVIPSSVDETTDPDLTAEQTVVELATRKAKDVSQRYPGRIVIGADTIVTIDDQIFGKPVDRNEAERMLFRLSGSTHQVLTAVSLMIQTSHREEQVISKTDVTFRNLHSTEIARYLDSGEPYDKAGAYGIQGGASLFTERIDGCFYNIVGFPVASFWLALERITDGAATEYCKGLQASASLSFNG
ncbi:MAG: Maf family protein [Candidatus Latescibacterota bacterium]|nr:Maf family protein [Candidatus Latescibacterota bacterium]